MGLRISKIGVMVGHEKSNLHVTFEVKMSKLQVTRPINVDFFGGVGDR